jgi:regulator of protease activity HflC (stomatin/prohibitin superfamily)
MKSKIFYLMMVLIGTLTISSCTRVDAGHEGIKVNLYGDNRGVDDVELVTGAVWYNPFTTAVYEYPTFVQTVDYKPFSFNSKDGSEFTFDPTIMLQIKSGAAPEVFKKYRKELDEVLSITLVPIIEDAFKEEINSRLDNDLITNQTEFQNAIEAKLAEELGRENFIVSKVTTGIKYPDALVESINAKNRALQEELRIKNEALVAEAEAAKKVAIAQGDAEALKIRADAEAYYNRTVAASLSPYIVQMEALEKWDGKLPVMAGGAAPFIDVNKFVK